MAGVHQRHGTAEVCDLYADSVQVLQSAFVSYGGISHCCGPVVTFHLDEDNRTLKCRLQGPGHGQIAVVDVAGDTCAVIGDRLAGFALENGWAGIILNGYLRDVDTLRTMPIAVWALGTCPRRSSKRAEGKTDVAIRFGGVEFTAGSYLYVDNDGIVLAEKQLKDINFTQ